MNYRYIRRFIENEYDNVGRIYRLSDLVRYDLPTFKNQYVEPRISYYSVTTALNTTANKEFLVTWRNRLGDEEADRELEQAQRYGTQFHLVGEHFLKQTPLSVSVHPFVKMIFSRLIPKLRPHITEVIAVEDVLYSDVVMLAGRADGIVRWNNELAVLDYKLVNFWNDEFIHDYWLQCTIYAHMWEFMYGERPKKIILAIGNKKTGMAKTIVGNPNEYAKETVERIAKFRDLNLIPQYHKGEIWN